MTYLKQQDSPVFYKILNNNEVLQVTKKLHSIGISVHSRLLQELFSGDTVEIQKEEFIAAYSEVKRELINQNVLQEEEKEAFLSEVFQEWADSYFPGNPEAEFIKEAVFTSMKDFSPKILGLFTSNMFKKQLRSWCSHNGYNFQDRILKLVNGKTTEHIRVTPLH
ncbi:hypothetical protein [Chryseobacterium flavum]|uniref:hypothetical protein n=1 Tax=Chryseobacterium flavum TaxID=415851 RepID=UPI0028A6CE67|nr:hypothetical protein [Chryseobacterium flavum]